jgi:hypothetical protein
MRWHGSAATVNDRPVLLSKTATPHEQTQTDSTKKSGLGPQMGA